MRTLDRGLSVLHGHLRGPVTLTPEASSVERVPASAHQLTIALTSFSVTQWENARGHSSAERNAYAERLVMELPVLKT